MKTILKNLIIVILFIILYSCEKDKQDKINDMDGFTKTTPTIPKAINIDLNGDSINDFKLSYYTFGWDGLIGSGYTISGYIEPLNSNLVLYQKQDYNFLFLKVNDTVFSTVENPYEWRSIPADIVSISTVTNYYWPNEWSISGDSNQTYQYLGIKINKDSKQILGLLKLTINKKTGEIEILDKRLTELEFIKVEN